MIGNTNFKGDLGYLGVNYQYKLVKVFLEDKDFFRDLANIIDQNMFTESVLKHIVGSMKEYYATRGISPNYTMLEILLREHSINQIEIDTYTATLNKLKDMSPEGEDDTKILADKFFKQQNIIKTANEILKIAGNGNTDKYFDCVDLLAKALSAGAHEDEGKGIFEDIEDTLSKDYRNPIPTGIEKIDEILQGGIGKGELGAIIGSTGFGKTTLTTAMASYAATFKCDNNNNSGFKVLQIVFEDTVKQIRRKHISRITNVEACDLSKDENIENVKNIVFEDNEENKMIDNNIKIFRLPSGEKTTQDIKEIIKRSSNKGFKPDLVIIDYFECLKISGGSFDNDKWEAEGKSMRKLESIAGELNVAIWVATQGTKDSLACDIVTMDKAGGSFKKMQIAHIVMSISKSLEDTENKIATIAILKNRAGQSGKILNGVKFDNGTCRISTDDSVDTDSVFDSIKKKETQKAEKISEMTRKLWGAKQTKQGEA